jgi:hypothetical protein
MSNVLSSAAVSDMKTFLDMFIGFLRWMVVCWSFLGRSLLSGGQDKEVLKHPVVLGVW